MSHDPELEAALNHAAQTIASQKNLPCERTVRLVPDLKHDLEIHAESEYIDVHPSLSAEKLLKRLSRAVELSFDIDHTSSIHEGVNVGRRA